MKVVCQVMPPLSVQEYVALKADIAARGARVPTALRQDKNRKVRPDRSAEEEKQISRQLPKDCGRGGET
jgi:hypothetical protein